MKLFTRVAPLLLFIIIAGQRKLDAQSIIDPTDPIINYNSSSPPAQPPWGQIGKWVRTPRMSWNTSLWKCYIYKNYAFRVKFPKTYNPTANDGKKYPVILFFHGYGEIAPNTDNEFHMLWGHQFFQNQVENGNFDGYVISMQSVGFFGVYHYAALTEIIQYMIVNNKLDPFRVATNGLSAGGQGSWDMMINYPAYAHAALPMSWNSLLYTEPSTLAKIKYSPIWHFQGGLDGNPAPYTTNYVQNIIVGVGGRMKNTLYPNNAHNTWVDAWNEPDFIPFINRAYASNAWPLYGKTEYYLGEPINQTIGVNPGFANYEWRKRGVLIPGANSNTLVVNDTGFYQCRVFLNGLWSEWSPTACYIKLKPAPTLPDKIEAESFLAMSGIQTENTADAGGGLNVGYIENGDWMDYGVVPPVNGTYSLKLRIASPNNGGQLQVRKSDGTVLATVSVPNTGGWQSWQTITTTFSLPAQYNGLRIISTANAGWNINWIEIDQIASAPTANAGTDQTIHLPTNTVQLNGSGTDTDGTITGYSWSKIAGPATFTITGGGTATPTVSNLVNGSYTFRLTVTDNGGNIGTDDVIVIVNQKPTSNAGTDQTIHLPTNSIQLNGSGTDADGTVSTYAWSKVSGPAGSTFSNAAVANPTVNSLAAGVHTFRLTVTDNNGGTATDDVVITVNQVPVVNAGTDVVLALPTNSTPLNGSATDPDAGGSISTYNWSKLSGPSQFTLSNNSIADPTLSNLVVGVYTFRLTATDNNGGSSTDDVVITVNAEPGVPTANAGTDQTIHLPTNLIQLNGSGTDEDGTIDTYSWSKLSGPAFTIDDVTLANPTLSNLVAGVYTFRLTVTDDDGKTATDDVVITVNTLPVVNAGTDQTIHLPANTANLSGGATDADAGSTISYSWTKISGPAFTISNANIANPGLSNLVAGTYTFRLTANDNNGGSATDDVVIIVNTPPTANAGTDVSLTLPANSTPLNGSGNDPDAGGSISTYNWSKISGPATFNIGNADIANTTLSNLVQGSYTFRLTVTDNRGAIATDDVIINVVPAVVRIEAETYSAMLGVQTESTTDAGGGLNVGYINLNDWMEYTINATQAGVHTLWFRIATPYTGQTLQVKNSGGTVLATVNIPQTAGWQTWSTTATQITLPAGTQTIRIQSTSTSGWNFNWMELMFGIPPSGKIEAEMYTNMSGIQTESTTDAGGGLNVGYVDNNDWMEYSVTTNAAGNYNINFRLAARNAAGQLQIRKADGTILATLPTPLTGGWQIWQTVTALNVPLAAGTQTIRIVCTAPANWNFNWLEIVQPPGGATNMLDVMPMSLARPGNMITEKQGEIFEIYPNPVRERMVIKLDNSYSGNITVQFFNAGGAVQKQLTFNKEKGASQHTLSLADLPRGEYVMVIDIKGARTTRKITKL